MRLLIGPIFSIRTVIIALCLSIAALAWADSPSNPPLVLSADDTAQLKGNAGGSIRATQYGVSKTGPCMGWIPKEPQHTVVLTGRALTNIAVHSTADTTLIVVGEVDGKRVVRCSDDVDGNDPGLNEILEAGTYKLYIGTWNAGTRVPFTMRIRTVTP